MIPALSAMIGAYIITRMVESASNKDARVRVTLLSIATIVITVISLILIFKTGMQASQINMQ